MDNEFVAEDIQLGESELGGLGEKQHQTDGEKIPTLPNESISVFLLHLGHKIVAH
jgi:hypothetical protein